MGLWTAVSDLDYNDERFPHRKAIACRTCGRSMAIHYNADGKPVFARCFHCTPERISQPQKKTA